MIKVLNPLVSCFTHKYVWPFNVHQALVLSIDFSPFDSFLWYYLAMNLPNLRELWEIDFTFLMNVILRSFLVNLDGKFSLPWSE